MDSTLRFYILTLALGLANLPLTCRVLDRLGGWAVPFARPLAALILTWTLWLARSVSPGPLPWDWAWLALLPLLGLNLLSLVKSKPAGGLGDGSRLRSRSRLRSWLAWETVFAGLFGLALVLRVHDPAALHTERPMDLMLLTASMLHADVPPPDLWLSGASVSYYYFGHYLVATLASLAFGASGAGLTPTAAYNCGLALAFALLGVTAAACAGILVSRLAPGQTGQTGQEGQADQTGPARTFVVCAVALGLTCLAAPPAALIELIQGRTPNGWWWWEAGRIIKDIGADGTPVPLITEFPAFSQIVGDLHAHVLSGPYLLLTAGLGLNLFLARAGAPSRPDASLRVIWPTLAVAALTLGVFPALDAWVTPAAALLLGLGLLPERPSLATAVRAGTIVLALAGVGLLLYLPFFPHFHSQFAGIILNVANPSDATQFLLWQGPFLVAVAAVAAARLPDLPRLAGPAGRAGLRPVVPALACLILPLALHLGLRALAIIAPANPADPDLGPALLSLDSPAHGLPIVLAGLGLVLALACLPALGSVQNIPASGVFAWRLAGLGAFLLLVPELVYARDLFACRMNTVFKLHYQAWILLAPACAALAFGTPAAGPRRALARVLNRTARTACLLLLLGVTFTVLAATDKARSAGPGPTGPDLDGLTRLDPDRRRALDWLRVNTEPHAVIACAPGASYDPDTVVPALSGRPLLLGWIGHELQWRGPDFSQDAARRTAILDTIFAGPDPAAVRAAIQAGRIHYIFVSAAELRRYPATSANLPLLRTLVAPVFITPGAIILKTGIE